MEQIGQPVTITSADTRCQLGSWPRTGRRKLFRPGILKTVESLTLQFPKEEEAGQAGNVDMEKP
jgi:hypothetical protein